MYINMSLQFSVIQQNAVEVAQIEKDINKQNGKSADVDNQSTRISQV